MRLPFNLRPSLVYSKKFRAVVGSDNTVASVLVEFFGCDSYLSSDFLGKDNVEIIGKDVEEVFVRAPVVKQALA